MPDPTTQRVTRAYLAELETALAGIPADMRNGLLDGVREELDGLSDGEALRRIQELGDPEFIASEAHAEAATALSNPSREKREPRWFSVIAALLVMVGGFVIPLLGAIAGLVMVWFSAAWSRKEKWIATLTPVAITLLLALVGIGSSLWEKQQEQTAGGDVGNPLIPVAFDLFTAGVLLVMVVLIGVGVWLLIRANRRSSSDRSKAAI